MRPDTAIQMHPGVGGVTLDGHCPARKELIWVWMT